MRQFFSLFVLLFPFVAGAYPCPEVLAKEGKVRITFDWLDQFKDQKLLHDCEIEITVCDPTEEWKSGAPVGELFVKTADGREAYLSIDFPDKESWRFKTKVSSYPRTLYYKKVDRFYEPERGRTEVWQMEIRTEWGKPAQLNHLDLGIYSTHTQLNQPNGNDSRWFNCHPPK